MTLHQIASTVRTANGEIVLCGPATFGFIFRAIVKGHLCRIILLKPGCKIQTIPSEPGCKTHVITDEHALSHWLQSLTPSRALQSV